MNGVQRRALMVAGLMGLAAHQAHVWRPTVHLSDKLGQPDLKAIFPVSFGRWKVDANVPIILPDPQTQALLNSIYNQTLSRTYVNTTGERVMLSVAYGGDQSDSTRAHLPEVCYPAQGFQISRNESGNLELPKHRLNVRRLMTRQGSRNEPVTFWMVIGDRIANNRTDQKLVEFRLGLKGYIPDGMLVRVSSIDADAERGFALQAAFLVDLENAIPDAAEARIFGAETRR